jgi:hypothetical protein
MSDASAPEEASATQLRSATPGSLHEVHEGAPGRPGLPGCETFAAVTWRDTLRRSLRHVLAAVLITASGAFASSADDGASAWPPLEEGTASVAAGPSGAAPAVKRPHRWLRCDIPPVHDLNLEEDVQPKMHGAVGRMTDAAPPLSDQSTGHRTITPGVGWIGASAAPRGPPSPFAS